MTYQDETILLHGGQTADPATRSRAVPIYQTTAYEFENTKEAADIFALKKPGNIYTRLMNPTSEVFEQRMAELDGGVGALALASGQSAITLAIINLAQAGDEIVSFDNLYGGAYNLFNHTLRRLGINVKFVNSSDPKNIEQAITDKTKAVYAESIGNPKNNITDIETLAKLAHKHQLPLILDNTVSPYLLKPIQYGADIVIYSATKFIGGHGTSMGGVIVDSGKFDWTVKENGKSKFPLLAEPDPSYHGLNFAKELGTSAYIVKVRTTVLRDTGPALSPFNSFLFLQGLETLHLRMARHVENALAVAKYLEKHSKVAWINYPGLPSSPEYKKAQKYLPKGAGAVLGFGIKGGVVSGGKFIDNLKLISHVANLGDAKSLAVHPASTTHQQLTAEEQTATGVTPDYIRLSIGIEHIDDIISDIEQALAKV